MCRRAEGNPEGGGYEFRQVESCWIRALSMPLSMPSESFGYRAEYLEKVLEFA